MIYLSNLVFVFQAVLSSEKMPSLEGVLVGGGKSLQYSKYT